MDAEDEVAKNQVKASLNQIKQKQEAVRDQVKALIVKNDPVAETRDTDYVFMRFVMDHLPVGIIGLLFAVIFFGSYVFQRF